MKTNAIGTFAELLGKYLANIAPLATVLMATMKLLGYVSWSWWVVFSPLLIGWVAATVVISIAIVELAGALIKLANAITGGGRQ